MGESTSEAAVPGIVENGDSLVVVTIRPDPTRSFRPHNLALTKEQAVRLLDDLYHLLAPGLGDAQIAEWLQLFQDVAEIKGLHSSSS